MYNDPKQDAIDLKEKKSRETLCEAVQTLIEKSEHGEIAFPDMRGEIALIMTLAEDLGTNMAYRR